MLFVDIGGSYLKIMQSDIVKRFEMRPDKILSVSEIKNKILSSFDEIEEIAFSCQMHGYVIDIEKNNFVTWRQQSNIPEFLNEKTFTKRTGLFLRNDLPICNLYYQIQNNPQLHNQEIKFLQISEALLDEELGFCTLEMICGSGFYDIHTNEYIQEYIDKFKEDFNVTLIFSKVVDKAVSGYINQKIKCYCGYGDMQCSLLGVNLKTDETSINMATGSQIAFLNEKEVFSDYEMRPFFGRYLKCLTHIPSGRLLLMFDKIFNVFEILKTLKLEDLKTKIDISISPDIFTGVNITNLTEENISVKNLSLVLLQTYLKQYTDKIPYIQKMVLSGGIAKKIPVILDFFKDFYQTENVRLNDNDDDSLNGLKNFFSINED